MGFEPTVPCGTHPFQGCAIDHSANPPVAVIITISRGNCKYFWNIKNFHHRREHIAIKLQYYCESVSDPEFTCIGLFWYWSERDGSCDGLSEFWFSIIPRPCLIIHHLPSICHCLEIHHLLSLICIISDLFPCIRWSIENLSPRCHTHEKNTIPATINKPHNSNCVPVKEYSLLSTVLIFSIIL